MRNGARILGVVVSLVCAVSWAAAPPLLPLQGVLTDQDGVPITTAVSVRFSLHTAQSGGSELWNETQSVTPVEGLFAAYLGSVTTLDLATFRDNGTVWLEVKVGADAAMPRVQIGSTAFAGFAQYCGTHTHAFGDVTGTLPAGSLPAGVPVGALSCSGTQNVRGITSAGQLVCAADTLAALGCTQYQIPKWNGSAWACASDEIGAAGTGDITEVIAGDGLTGGATAGPAPIAIMSCAQNEILQRGASAWACSTNYRLGSWVPAWSDITGRPAGLDDGDNDTLGALSCADGAVVKRLSGVWDCGVDQGVVGGGTANYLAMFTGASAIGNSGVYQAANGAVGVGTATPGADFNSKLDVVGKHSYRTNAGDTTKGLVVDNTGTSHRIYSDAATGTPYDLILGTYPNGHANQLVLAQATGNVGIGIAAPNYKLEVDGSAHRVDNLSTWTTTSDARLKEHIQPLGNALSRLLGLRGVTFEWKRPENHGNVRGPQMGLIAQEVEQVFPDWVATGADGYKVLNVRGFEALTVEAMRELRAENDRVARENARLRAQLVTLDTRLGRLEQRVAPLLSGRAELGLGGLGLGALLLGGVVVARRRRAS